MGGLVGQNVEVFIFPIVREIPQRFLILRNLLFGSKFFPFGGFFLDLKKRLGRSVDSLIGLDA